MNNTYLLRGFIVVLGEVLSNDPIPKFEVSWRIFGIILFRYLTEIAGNGGTPLLSSGVY